MRLITLERILKMAKMKRMLINSLSKTPTRKKKLKADEDSDIITYVNIGTVIALGLVAAFAIMRLRRA
jgi:hypothetical protein